MTFTDDAKAVIALTSRLGDSKRPSLPPTRWHELSALLASNSLRPSDLFSSSLKIEEIPGMSADLAASIRHLMADASGATVAADELGRKGIWTLTVVDDGYPQALSDRLGRNAPPVIFGVGNAGLLSGEGIGIVGSRNVRAEGAEVTQQIASAAVEISRTVISGGARGVDQLAMNAAYQAGGSVVGVLADSLQARIRNADILGALDAGSTCLITQQAPSSGFTPASAMGRNKLIYALSIVTVVIATDDATGGTWAGATEALKNSNGVVAVWRGEGEGPGNAALEQRGGVPLRTVEGLGALLELESLEIAPQPDDSVQLGLLDTA